MAYLANRIVFRVVGDIQAKLFRAGVFPFRMLTCRRSPLAKELLFSLLNKIRRNEPGPWMAYGHLMDLHDRRLINRPLRVARKMAWYPKWRRLRQDGDNVMRFLYDAALHEFDKDLGRLIDALKAKGAYDNTVFLITGDHGCEMHDAKRRGNNEVFGFRSHPEHIEVPLICGPMDKKPHDAGLHDLMSVPATVLDIAQAGTHPSFKGVSIFEQGRDYVVTENAGRGNADLQRKDLYFTLTEQSRKMMALIRKDQLFVTRLYNTHDDSYELNNIVDDPDENGMIHQLLDYLFDARGEILSLRGVQRDRVVVGRLSNE